MEASEAMQMLDGTGRVDADLGKDRKLDAGVKDANAGEDVRCSDDWSAADSILAQVPRRGVPVTVLTGFLGAGKTTVLNYLLRQEHGLRIAVLINEFGEVDIDSQIIERGSLDSDQTILLKNGCICCTISNSFVDSVQRVLSTEGMPPPDYLVIETSGIADPEPILTNLQETELDDLLYVDQVLTVVDTVNFFAEEMESTAARSQIHTADTILLSKMDLATPAQVDAVSKELLRLKPGVRIFPSQRGQIPVAALFDVGMHMASATATTTAAAAATRSKQEDQKKMHSGHAQGKSPSQEPQHLLDDGFQSLAFTSDRPFDLKRFRKDFLKQLPSIEQDEWPAGAKRRNQLVVIGRQLDRAIIRTSLESCLVDAAEDFVVLDRPSAKTPATEG